MHTALGCSPQQCAKVAAWSKLSHHKQLRPLHKRFVEGEEVGVVCRRHQPESSKEAFNVKA